MFKNNRVMIIIISVIVVLLAVFLIFVSRNKKEEDSDIEETLIADMKDYYSKYLEGKVIGITKHKVALEMLKKTGYDMKPYEECDLEESYSYIEDKDNNVSIENHLSCDNK